MNQYRYHPLKRDEDEIRLLTILPGSFSERVLTRLTHLSFSANSSPQYEALSYTWGPADNPQEIYIQSQTEDNDIDFGSPEPAYTNTKLSVTQNLDSAIRHLRYLDRARTLWVDAICIDQQNLPERSAEVGRMGEIYRRAQQVVVWLGPEADDCNLVHDVIARISRSMTVDWTTMTSSLIPDGDPTTVAETEQSFDKAYDPRTRLAIQRWIGRSWFQRLWIWQEVHLARNATVKCGHHTMPYHEFRVAVYCFSSQLNRLGDYPDESHDSLRNDMVRARGIIDNYTVRSTALTSLLQRTKLSLCTDPRDRVYALLSMIDRGTAESIRPDYERSVADVYADVVLDDVYRNKSLRLLRQCGVRDQPSSLHLPTWVPDWSRPKHSPDISLSRASGLSAPEATHESPGVLGLSGIHCATVEHVACPVPYNASQSQALKICQTWEPHNLMNSSYVDGESMLDAYCRTLTCNATADQRGGRGSYPTIEESRAAFMSNLWSGRKEDLYSGHGHSHFIRLLLFRCYGQAFFRTLDGHIGLAPVGIQKGDHICVLLGCRPPMLLRADCMGHYRVIGACYVHALMDSESILGPLPFPWKNAWKMKDNGTYEYQYINLQTQLTTREDPRLGPLPPPWKSTWNGDVLRFENISTGEVTKADPRLASVILKARGINIKTFYLI